MHGDECRFLTVREAFAAAALTGLLVQGVDGPPFASAAQVRAKLAAEAWALADAMLAAKDGQPE